MTAPRLDLGDLAALAALVRAVEAIGWERTAGALAASRRPERATRGRAVTLRRPAEHPAGHPAAPGDPLARRLPALESAPDDRLGRLG